MTQAKKPGRPRKWASDAERMRARRAAQSAERERIAEELRTSVLEGAEPVAEDQAAKQFAELPHPESHIDLERFVQLLMIACRVEGGIHEWLHQTCVEEHDRVLTALIDEQEFTRVLMEESKSLDRVNRSLRERLVVVDPEGPLSRVDFITNRYPNLRGGGRERG